MLSRLKSILHSNGFVLYKQPYELNIVGLRSSVTTANRFDDEIHVFYRTEGIKWNYHVYNATTDPGTFWLKNPMQPQGTAILAQGQYVNAYRIGLHKGQYKALVQCKPVTVIRDYDRDAVLDWMNGVKMTGYFGIDIHRAAVSGITKTVDRYSAGCQVFADADNFYEFMDLCEKHRQLYGNHFTYTLIDFRALKRELSRRLLLAGVGVVGVGLGLWAYYSD